jgi:hypothetical protein
MKRKHFLQLAHAIRRMFSDPNEVKFTSMQRTAIVDNLGYFARQITPTFDQVLFQFVIDHGREMSDNERVKAGIPPAGRDIKVPIYCDYCQTNHVRDDRHKK